MVNSKKIDEQDLIFLNQSWTAAEKKSFSEYLKSRKKPKQTNKDKSKLSPNNDYKAAG